MALMRIILVSGFLGSGKTTTILDLARFLTRRQGGHVAVVVNEAGDIPMDGAVLTAGGNRVKEIFAGCVCCQVATSLVGAVREMDSVEKPDYLLIEPSGLADPQRIHTLLARAGQKIWRSLYILDAPRFELLLQAARPVITNGVQGAEAVLVNKAELVDQAALKKVGSTITGIKDDVLILPVTARQGIPIADWQQVLDNEQ
jgi:G3E family GTPase